MIDPADGARLLVDASAGSRVVLRSSAADARWEVDGSMLHGGVWEPTSGRHAIVAIHQGRRSPPAWVEVVGADPK